MKFNLKNTYFESLSEKFYSREKLKSVKKVEFVIFNKNLAENLELKKDEIEKIFNGEEIIEDSIPIAQAYAGHQFGHFNMLGDGRAILLGEKYNKEKKLLDIQLKGSGKTRYSRGGDGKATLRAMLREYLISEAMNNFNVSTTRSLGVFKTGESIKREKLENGAILIRLASSHIRVGTFEYASNFTSKEDLKKLADYTINRHFPKILKKFTNSNKKYLELIKSVISVQASLIAKWKLLGFIHGVMNTDNMTISGETIDYGPCAFMDIYKEDKVFSSIDYYGRYSYANQEKIGLWNLLVFAESLYPLFEYTYKENASLNIDGKEAQKILEKELFKYNELYKKNWLSGMRKKLGINIEVLDNEDTEDEEKFYEELLKIMEKYSADYTNTFVALTENNFNLDDKINSSLYHSNEFNEWKKKWKEKLREKKIDEDSRKKVMRENNPFVIPRNNIVEEVLKNSELGDHKELEKFLDILKNPYNYDRNIEEKYLSPTITDKPYKTYCGT